MDRLVGRLVGFCGSKKCHGWMDRWVGLLTAGWSSYVDLWERMIFVLFCFHKRLNGNLGLRSEIIQIIFILAYEEFNASESSRLPISVSLVDDKVS